VATDLPDRQENPGDFDPAASATFAKSPSSIRPDPTRPDGEILI
jgi:hypothetical protein